MKKVLSKRKIFQMLVLTGIAHLSLALPSVAGTIISGPSASGAMGHGGFNFDNTTVRIMDADGNIDPNGIFVPETGAYTIQEDGLYGTDLYSVTAPADTDPVIAVLLGKDWPVGEPPGIKIINNDILVKEGSPQNCIMATSYLEPYFLDTANPVQVTCSSPFQSHKRFKIAMLPELVAGGAGAEQGFDMVFNVEPGATADYQVFQKINNYTDSRLEGFTLQVGFNVGDEFVAAGTLTDPASKLSVSVPTELWDDYKRATFSHGLFGAADKHFPEDGFFDDDPSGFYVSESLYPGSTVGDTLVSGATLGSNYAQVPPVTGPVEQFGTWLPASMLPEAIFFDEDVNPDTDDALMAWWGFHPDSNEYTWMKGNVDGFAAATADEISGWVKNPLCSIGEIEDLVNLALNYMVTVGTVDASWPTWNEASGNATFTIRITPRKDTSGIAEPGYKVNPPSHFTYTDSVAEVAVNPSPQFVAGNSLLLSVADADLNLDPAVAETVDVTVSTTLGETETITLTEISENRGVFSAPLATIVDSAAGAVGDFAVNAVTGTVVTMSYDDGGSDVTALSTAADPVVEEEIVILDILNIRTPDIIKTGQSINISVRVANDALSEANATGTVTLIGSDGTVLTGDFENLEPGRKVSVKFPWTAPDTAQTIDWTATVVSGDYSTIMTASKVVVARNYKNK